MNNVIKTATVRDSKGIDHEFNIIKADGYYTFSWDGKPVDWSFTTNNYDQAFWHFKRICEDVLEINNMNSWVNG